MRIKVLMLGSDPVSLMTDAQLLRERGLLAITACNMQHVNELVSEVKPDVIFFDSYQPNNAVTDAYNSFIANSAFTKTPVILTLTEDDTYLVTRDRKQGKNERTIIADSIMGAIKMALEEQPIFRPKQKQKIHSHRLQDMRAGLLFM